MTIINFSYNQQDFESVLADHRHIASDTLQVFDFAATISRDLKFPVTYPSQIDQGNTAHYKALRDYVDQMGLLSRVKNKSGSGDIRSIRVGELPVYWLTDISEKHPQNCVLKNLFYFKHLYHQIIKDKEQILVILPAKGLHFQSGIRAFMERNGFHPESISFNKPFEFKTGNYIYFHYLRNFSRKLRLVKKSAPKGSTAPVKFDNLILTYYPQTWRGGSTGDYVMGGIHKLCDEKKITFRYLPVFFNYSDLAEFKSDERFDTTVFKSMPGHSQLLKLYFELFQATRAISRAEYDLSSFSFVDKIALQHEFHHVLHNKLEFFVNFTWLKNYFNSTDFSFKVFYQDEFYPSGRLVSKSVQLSENKGIESFGVQHGIFYEAHTVYNITDNELTTTGVNDQIPAPKRFVTWGKFFSDLFLSSNSLPQNYVVDAGNLNYIQRSSNSASTASGTKKLILWCTSLKSDVVTAYNTVIKDFIHENEDALIVIRCHPQIDLKSFIKNDLVKEDFDRYFTFSSKKDILDDIAAADIVLAVSGSTVFLDALVAKKPVFHIVNNDYYMGSLGQNEMTHITSSKEMSLAFRNYKNGKIFASAASGLLTLDEDKWVTLLSKN